MGFDRKNPTKVVADATPAGLGVVLIQWQKEAPCIICSVSKSLTDEKKKCYCHTECEALRLVKTRGKFTETGFQKGLQGRQG